MTAPRFAGIGGHHGARTKTEEWLTPPAVLAALGGWQSFDLDPCAPIARPWPTARHHFTALDNGLIQDWRAFRRLWLNPPYSTHRLRRWLARMAEHNCGVALIFARTETRPFFAHVWQRAAALLFIRGRLIFHTPDGRPAIKRDGSPANAGGPSVLVAYGMQDADLLASCAIDGQFVPLLIPRSVLVQALAPTWAQLLADWFKARRGAVRLEDLYRAFAGHVKTRGNRTWQATLRRTLQEGPFRNVRRGEWEAA